MKMPVVVKACRPALAARIPGLGAMDLKQYSLLHAAGLQKCWGYGVLASMVRGKVQQCPCFSADCARNIHELDGIGQDGQELHESW